MTDGSPDDSSNTSRRDDALARIDAAFARIETAAARHGADEQSETAAERHGAMEREVRSTLTELDELIGRLEQ